MPRPARPSLWKGAVSGLVAGFAGSYVKAAAEPPLQRLGERLFPPAHGEKLQRGADPTGHPERMPPAEMIRAATPVPLDRSEVLAAQQVAHYVFGSAVGVAYGMLAETAPVGAGLGVPAGAALWAATHGSVVPALGFQADLDDLPEAWWVWEFGSHLTFGLAVEIVRRVVRSAL